MDLQEIYSFFNAISHRLSKEEAYKLQEVYTYIEDKDEVCEKYDTELAHAHDHVSQLIADLTEISVQTDKKEQPAKLKQFLQTSAKELDVAFTEKEDALRTEKRKKDVLQMIKRGFIFTSGYEKQLYEEYIAEQQGTEREKAAHTRINAIQTAMSKQLEDADIPFKIIALADDSIHVYSAHYGVDAAINLRTLTIKGNGARKFKTKLLEVAKIYKKVRNEQKDAI